MDSGEVVKDHGGLLVIPETSEDVRRAFFPFYREGSGESVAEEGISQLVFQHLTSLTQELRIVLPEVGTYAPVAFVNHNGWAYADQPEGNDRGRIRFNSFLLEKEVFKLAKEGKVGRLSGLFEMVGSLAHEAYHLFKRPDYSEEESKKSAENTARSMATGTMGSWAELEPEKEAEQYALDYLKRMNVRSLPEILAKRRAILIYQKRLKKIEGIRKGILGENGLLLPPKQEEKLPKMPAPPPLRRMEPVPLPRK